jgi:hypothetical protein
VIRRLLAVCLLAGALTACSGAGRPTLTDDTLPGRRCSADGMPVGTPDSDGMPDAVARRRQQLIDAAVNCDYRELGRIARQTGVDLRFEGEVVPVRQWREREHDGIAILRPLAGLLGLAHVRRTVDGVEAFTWPNAVEWPFSDVADERDRRDLLEVVGEGGIFGWAEAGGYSGWRVTIGPRGEWLRFWFGPVEGEYP